MRTRAGLTMIELLVVLLILSILTVVAVQSTDVIVDQGRYDGTQQTLKNIEEAVVGPKGQRQADGTLLITGFVADMGRLPVPVGTAPETQLQELWNPTPSYGLFPPSSLVGPAGGVLTEVADLRQGSGYRGPYLRLPITSTTPQLRDGWANPFSLAFTAVGPRTQSMAIQSAGGPTAPYLGPLPTPPKTIAQLDAYALDVRGIVKEKVNQGGTFIFQPSAAARVYLLEPDGAAQVKARFTLTNAAGEFVFGPVDANDLGVSIGPRIIRVVKTYPPPNPNPGMLGPFTAADTLNITVTPGALGNLTLNLVPPDPYNQVTPQPPM